MAASKGLFQRRKFSFDLPSTSLTNGFELHSATKQDIKKLNLKRNTLKRSVVDYQLEIEEESQVDRYMSRIRIVKPKSLMTVSRNSMISAEKRDSEKMDVRTPPGSSKISRNLRMNFGGDKPGVFDKFFEPNEFKLVKTQIPCSVRNPGSMTKLIGPKTSLMCLKKPVADPEVKQAPVPILISRFKSSERNMSVAMLQSKSKLPVPLSFYKPNDEFDHDVVPEPMRQKQIPPAIYAEESSYFDLTPKKQNESIEPLSRQPKRRVRATHIDTQNKLISGSPSGWNLATNTIAADPPEEIFMRPHAATSNNFGYTEKKVLIMRETSLSSKVVADKTQTPRHFQRDSNIAGQSDAAYDFSELANQQDDLMSKQQSNHMLQVPYSAKSLQSLGQQSVDLSERASAAGKDESFQQQTGFSKTKMKKKVITAAAEVI